MAQMQHGRDFHTHLQLRQDDHDKSWGQQQQQQQNFNSGNYQHIRRMQQNHFNSSFIPENIQKIHENFQQGHFQQNNFLGTMQQQNDNFPMNMQQNHIPGHIMQHSNFHGNMQLAGNVNRSQQNANMFAGAPYTSYQGHFLVPVKTEVEQLAADQLRDRFMEFVKVGKVNFDTLVFHTGSGELHRLGFYFNQHIMSIVVLNAMFNNSSQDDRAQFNQVPEELRLFNMHEQQKQQKTPGALGMINQELFMTAQQVFRQQELDQKLQAWRMESAQAHLRTLDWVLHQEPYEGSDAQDSVDREEEMIRRRVVEMESTEEEMELDCAFNTKDESVSRQSLGLTGVNEAQVQQPTLLSPRRTRSGAVLCPNSPEEMSVMEHSMFSPRRTRNGALY